MARRQRGASRIRFIRSHSVASLAGSSDQRHTLFAPGDPHGPLTILGIRMNLWFQKTAASISSLSFAYGIIVDSAAAGTGQNPTPTAEPHAQWLWVERDALLSTDEDGTSGVGTQRYNLMIKAKRRMKTDDNLYLIVQNLSSSTINYSLGTIITIKR